MPASRIRPAAENFIREHLELCPLPFRPDLSLYRPTPKSGLIAFLAEQGRADDPPYWAYAWAGAAVLTLYLRDHPGLVAGKSVLDFGAGSGLVAIASAKAGAVNVMAFEPDPLGQIALQLNAQANDVGIARAGADAEAEIVLAGDVFYDEKVAATTLPALAAHAARGATVLIGDPFRRDLPLQALDLVAEYEVPDMGGDTRIRSGIFALHH